MAIKQPKFKILKKSGDIELREYDGYIIATVNTTADGHAAAGSSGFGPLAGYIFGENKVRQQMSMTAPVITTKNDQSQKISMTAPVMSQNTGESSYQVSFVMPPSFTMQDLPIPNNSDVKLQEVPRHKSLAISFSGYTSESKIDEKQNKLQDYAKKHDIALTGKPKLARYDAPWKPGFLRHNEIIVDCK